MARTSNHSSSRISCCKQTVRSRSQRGWSLIEILVVISIIVILLGIIINTAVEKTGPEQQTKVTVRAAMAIATEYEVRTQLQIDHANSPTGYTGAATGMGRFIYAVMQIGETQKMLTALGTDALDSKTNPTQILDGWGKPLRYVNVVDTGDSYTADDQMPKRPSPYFASAGPDGEWGVVSVAGVADTNASDNVYSFNLD